MLFRTLLTESFKAGTNRRRTGRNDRSSILLKKLSLAGHLTSPSVHTLRIVLYCIVDKLTESDHLADELLQYKVKNYDLFKPLVQFVNCNIEWVNVKQNLQCVIEGQKIFSHL